MNRVCMYCVVCRYTRPAILRKGNGDPNTPLQKLFKKNRKNLFVNKPINTLFKSVFSINYTCFFMYMYY